LCFCAPSQDCQGDKFNAKVLAPIRRELDVDWRSCPGHSSTNEEFWKHEWSKHGTCSGLDMLGYFNTTMQLLHKYSSHCADMVEVQVAPGYSYPVPNKECRLCLKKNYELC
jgi:ribonuclease T2